MLPDVLASLRCPLCRAPLTPADRALRCAAGHAFDVARQGYVSFLVGRPTGLVGDDAAMVEARARFLAAGHFAPLADAIAAAARETASGPGIVVEVGAGTGYHLARVLDGLPTRAGLAIDLSRYAARRAARAHARATAIVTDARSEFPLADGSVALALDVFAPRRGDELRRILREDGALIVVTPERHHLSELRGVLGLLEVDPEKERRVEGALAPHLEREASRPLAWVLELPREDVVALASMGPSARHVAPGALEERAAALPERSQVTASVAITTWRRRG
jgi:23S rRNA (guanine745-N1)-methyltransferase